MAERVTIRDAAARLGVSADTIRRRLRAGTLTGERVSTPQGHRWVVALPVTLEPPPVADPGKPISVRDSAGADALEVAALRERVAGLERLGAELATDRDAWRERAAQDADAARELRILLGRAQELTRALPAGDVAPTDDQGTASTPVAPWWRRLWGGR